MLEQRKKRGYFSQRKLHFFLKPIFIISIIFILYQLIIFMQLIKDVNKAMEPNLVSGIHRYQSQFYAENERDEFVCIVSLEKISYRLINDDYCDCLDGSDEPGTNACANGQFFCALQVDHLRYPKVISSSKVNDGVCDCCDGSDEWQQKELPHRLSAKVQSMLKRYQSPCPNLCGRS